MAGSGSVNSKEERQSVPERSLKLVTVLKR